MSNKKLVKFLGLKIGTLIVLLIAVSVISFILIEIISIGPFRMYIGEMSLSQERLDDLMNIGVLVNQ
ncbi:MAG: hypothetical protein LBB45_07015 [Methanobrevibacter sp.]|jgi:ABC-type dipeptide/oligopeptide/nickel transport system permease component|nr:hypothetical protein [Candidatus Methanovirga basalitermitum]